MNRVSDTVITEEEISVESVVRSVTDRAAGATVLFLGTVRDTGEMGAVRELTYDAYVPLARKTLDQIRKQVLKRWPVKGVTIVHRTGRLRLEEVSVAVAVSSAHRQEAFEACSFAMDEIKRAVPIWKKETLATGVDAWTEGQAIEEVESLEKG